MDYIADSLQGLPEKVFQAVQALRGWTENHDVKAYLAYLKFDFEVRQMARDVVSQMK